MRKRTKFIIGAGLAAGVLYASKTEAGQLIKGAVYKWTDDDYIINLGKPDEVRATTAPLESGGGMVPGPYPETAKGGKSTVGNL